MKTVNTVTLLGNVTNPPEIKTLEGGQAICKFGLATNRFKKGANGEKQEEPEFHNLVVFGKLGELAGQYVKKGKPLFVSGRLKTGSWEKPKGTKHYRTEIIVDDFVLLGAKSKAGDAAPAEVEEAVAV